MSRAKLTRAGRAWRRFILWTAVGIALIVTVSVASQIGESHVTFTPAPTREHHP